MKGLANFKNSNFYFMFAGDLILFSASLFLAYLFRFDFDIPPHYLVQVQGLLKYVLITKAAFFLVFGLYRGMWRYTSLNDFWRLLRVTTLQNMFLIAFVLYRFSFIGIPRSVFFLDWGLTLLLCGGLRLSIRTFYTRSMTTITPLEDRKNILIVGAGRAGEKVAREVIGDRGRYNLVGFIDDDRNKRGRAIHGKPILGPSANLEDLTEHFKIDEIFIALTEVSGEDMRCIVDRCKATGVKYRTLPPLSEIMDGNVSIKALRDVNFIDLLGRSQIRLDESRIQGYLSEKTVLVTGCGGSIGSELCRQIIRFAPLKLVLVDSSEFNLYQIQMELHHVLGYREIVPVLGSITDAELMKRTFAQHRPAVVFHAAAYKHVPMLEQHPWQAVLNNILGSKTIMDVAVEFRVERFVVVSTDKAVRPTNVMGASKRVTELLMQARRGKGTRFMAVRFGNVVGSSGSVVPLFRSQIENGGPVTVTDPRMTRYFMSIAEASQLILQAGSMGDKGTGGEIFVLDMGTPVKIVDMARDLIRLSGKEPDTDIHIEYTGLRDGEKLFEELITEGEGIIRTEHEKILVLGSVDNESFSPEAMESIVAELVTAAHNYDPKTIRTLLRRLVPEYQQPF